MTILLEPTVVERPKAQPWRGGFARLFSSPFNTALTLVAALVIVLLAWRFLRWTVFDAAWSALKSGGRLVANAVSLETEARLAGYFQHFGGDLIRLQVARADRVGAMSGWRPAMPVTQWRVRKP